MTNLAMPNTFEQIPLSTVMSRIDAGNECLLELIQSFKARLEMEEKTIALRFVKHSPYIARESVYLTICAICVFVALLCLCSWIV
jgi:hypothetical protein